jgi:hypothetical protein
MTFDELPDAVEQLINDVRQLKQLAGRSDRLLEKEWYTLREAAELKGISESSLRKRPRRYWPHRGEGHAVIKSGKHSRMFHRSEVAEWLPLTEQDIDRRIEFERRTGREAG